MAQWSDLQMEVLLGDVQSEPFLWRFFVFTLLYGDTLRMQECNISMETENVQN